MNQKLSRVSGHQQHRTFPKAVCRKNLNRVKEINIITHVNGFFGTLKWPLVKLMSSISRVHLAQLFYNVNLGSFVPESFLLLYFSNFQLEALLCTDNSDLKAFKFVS